MDALKHTWIVYSKIHEKAEESKDYLHDTKPEPTYSYDCQKVKFLCFQETRFYKVAVE